MPGRQLVIVLGGLGRWLGATDRLNLGVGELFYGKRLTLRAFDALILAQWGNHAPLSFIPYGCDITVADTTLRIGVIYCDRRANQMDRDWLVTKVRDQHGRFRMKP